MASRSLKGVSVVPDIDVGQVVDELHQDWDHCVEAVGVHFLSHEGSQAAGGCIDPSVQHVACLGHINLQEYIQWCAL